MTLPSVSTNAVSSTPSTVVHHPADRVPRRPAGNGLSRLFTASLQGVSDLHRSRERRQEFVCSRFIRCEGRMTPRPPEAPRTQRRNRLMVRKLRKTPLDLLFPESPRRGNGSAPSRSMHQCPTRRSSGAVRSRCARPRLLRGSHRKLRGFTRGNVSRERMPNSKRSKFRVSFALFPLRRSTSILSACLSLMP